jgi:hypothetical protein
MKRGDSIIIKESPSHYLGYCPVKVGETFIIEETTCDGYVTTTKYPEMYLSVKQIEVVNENNIECKIQMPSH